MSEVDGWLSVPRAADRLRTTPPTVRELIARKELEARSEQRGQRIYRFVSVGSVEDYLREHGPFARHAPGALVEKLEGLDQRIATLEREAERRGAATGQDHPRSERFTNADLHEVIRLQRAAAALSHEADEARSQVVAGLHAALDGAELADQKRREAVRGLQTIIDIILAPAAPSEMDA